MRKTEKSTYIVPLCRVILLPLVSSILSESTKGASTFRYIVPLILFLPACERLEETTVTPEPPVQGLVMHTLKASTPGEDVPETRTYVSALDNNTKIFWSAKEKISILSGGGNYLFQGDNDTAASSASFTGEAPSDLGSYIALYPYDASATYTEGYVSTTLPSVQTGKASTFADGYLITADDATGNSISFNHLCSGLRFMVTTDRITAVSIRGNNGEKIAGDFRFRFTSEDTPAVEAGTEECVTLRPPGGHFEIGTSYYIVILPTVFTKGFTLIVENDGQVGQLRFDSEVIFTAGKFKNITGALNSRISSWTTPKIYYGPENSFCLRPGGSVSFDVSPRLIEGSWQRGPVPMMADVPDGTQVLWGNSTASLSGTILTLTAAATEGSSLIAIKKGDTILWSYLIWVTAEAPSGNVIPPLGGQLYFQWGRKDPLSAASAYAGNQGAGGLSYSISHPCDFIEGVDNGYDWFTDSYSNQDDTLWGEGGSKTVWDPCPSGYRVPSSSDGVSGTSDDYGYLICIGNNLFVYGGNMYWTRDAYKDYTPHQSYYSSYSSDIPGRQFRYIAYPVRCIKE